jgi:Spy/CpxP family protein refolding chaperone
MIGFIIGIACLWGLVRVIRGGRYGRGPWRMGRGCGSSWRGGCDEGHGGDWHANDWHQGGWRDRGGWGKRGHFFLRGIFEHLETTPGQEKEIKAVIDEVMEAASRLKTDLHGTRGDVGKAFRGDDFNEELMATLLTRHDERIDELRKTIVGGLARIHAALDPDQRKVLARFIENGPRWAGGPYRTRHAHA